MVMMGIQFPILVEHLTWSPGPAYRRVSSGPIGLPAPLRPRDLLVFLAAFPRCLSLILVAHGWGMIPVQFSEHAPLTAKKSQLRAQPACQWRRGPASAAVVYIAPVSARSRPDRLGLSLQTQFARITERAQPLLLHRDIRAD